MSLIWDRDTQSLNGREIRGQQGNFAMEKNLRKSCLSLGLPLWRDRMGGGESNLFKRDWTVSSGSSRLFQGEIPQFCFKSGVQSNSSNGRRHWSRIRMEIVLFEWNPFLEKLCASDLRETGEGSTVLDGDSYGALQFHIHTPSEHTVDGNHADIEFHFVPLFSLF